MSFISKQTNFGNSESSFLLLSLNTNLSLIIIIELTLTVTVAYNTSILLLQISSKWANAQRISQQRVCDCESYYSYLNTRMVVFCCKDLIRRSVCFTSNRVQLCSSSPLKSSQRWPEQQLDGAGKTKLTKKCAWVLLKDSGCLMVKALP